MIRITTLGMISPWSKDIDSLDDLISHLARIGYLQPALASSKPGKPLTALTPADKVSMESVQYMDGNAYADALPPDGTTAAYVIRQDGLGGPRRHRIEFLSVNNDPIDFEYRCHRYGIPYTGNSGRDAQMGTR